MGKFAIEGTYAVVEEGNHAIRVHALASILDINEHQLERERAGVRIRSP